MVRQPERVLTPGLGGHKIRRWANAGLGQRPAELENASWRPSAEAFAVNGQPRQAGTTADMSFAVDHLVWYLSRFMVLEPGDVVSTGTPAGVARQSWSRREPRRKGARIPALDTTPART